LRSSISPVKVGQHRLYSFSELRDSAIPGP